MAIWKDINLGKGVFEIQRGPLLDVRLWSGLAVAAAVASVAAYVALSLITAPDRVTFATDSISLEPDAPSAEVAFELARRLGRFREEADIEWRSDAGIECREQSDVLHVRMIASEFTEGATVDREIRAVYRGQSIGVLRVHVTGPPPLQTVPPARPPVDIVTPPGIDQVTFHRSRVTLDAEQRDVYVPFGVSPANAAKGDRDGLRFKVDPRDDRVLLEALDGDRLHVKVDPSDLAAEEESVRRVDAVYKGKSLGSIQVTLKGPVLALRLIPDSIALGPSRTSADILVYVSDPLFDLSGLTLTCDPGLVVPQRPEGKWFSISIDPSPSDLGAQYAAKAYAKLNGKTMATVDVNVTRNE